jgi:2-keto-4-pentenoate hydratase/2-oxohepta-3-ene-1,7-dioic acid hydratase in catechol pathway
MRIHRVLTPGQAIIRVTDFDGRQGKLVTGDVAKGFTATSQTVAVARVLPPALPRTVIAVGLNYRNHAEELNLPIPEYPVVFAKFPNAVTATESPIVLPRGRCLVEKADYEAELAVVIGRRCKNVTPEQALEHVAGYTCANDVSARDWQLERSGGQWSRGKSFDTFLPLGPCLVTPESIPDPQTLRVQCRVNGETLQDGHTDDMIFSIAEIISFLSQDTTLESETVIITGTPAGVGVSRNPQRFLHAGDQVEVEIEKIGILRNAVQ